MAKEKSKKKAAKKQKQQVQRTDVAPVTPDRFDEMRAALQARVKASRYRHSLGVSQTAEQLARIYGVSQTEAAVAGLLHDWDKALTGEQLKRKAKKLKLANKDVREHATGVLHSWTAAATLRDEFPELSDAVLQAISRHTCGAVGMSDLDMVVFVADIIEPGRDFPDIAALREAVGQVCLEELFYRTYKANFMYLLSANMVVAPPSLDVYNSLVVAREQRAAEEAEAQEAAAQAQQAPDDAMKSLAEEIARREQLAREAEQQMALARKAAEERERVREEKRAHMQAEHAERFAPEQQSASAIEAAAKARALAEAQARAKADAEAAAKAEAEARAQAAAAHAQAVAKAKAEAAKRAQEKAAAEAQAQAKAASEAQAAAAHAVERTPGGARIIPIQ